MSARDREIGRRIRNLRRQQKITQEGLGRALGMARHAVLDIEHGRRMVTLDEGVAFAIYFDVPLEYLAGVTNGYTKVGS